MASGSAPTWREPTVIDVVVETMIGDDDGATRRRHRDLAWPAVVTVLVVLIAIALPRFDLDRAEWMYLIVPIAVLAWDALSAARRQRRFGRPLSRAVAAAMTKFIPPIALLGGFLAVNQAFGGDPDAMQDPVLRLLAQIPTEAILVGLTILAVVLLIKLMREPGRREERAQLQRAKTAALEAAYRAERDARAAARGASAAAGTTDR
jgi:hypothetical protein